MSRMVWSADRLRSSVKKSATTFCPFMKVKTPTRAFAPNVTQNSTPEVRKVLRPVSTSIFQVSVPLIAAASIVAPAPKAAASVTDATPA